MKDKIKEQIDKIEFGHCPIEIEEEYFWRWTEHAKEILSCYLEEIVEDAKKEEAIKWHKIIKEIRNGKNNKKKT